jgi:hypothetical protein
MRCDAVRWSESNRSRAVAWPSAWSAITAHTNPHSAVVDDQTIGGRFVLLDRDRIGPPQLDSTEDFAEKVYRALCNETNKQTASWAA